MTSSADTTADISASLPSYNECRYAYIDAQENCRSDRNCADCLRKTGCRISVGGYCEPDSSLNDPQADSLNYKQGVVNGNVSLSNDRTNSSTATQKWHFPASQVTYCSGDDVVCNRCSATNYGAGSGVDDSRFCVGKGGCVCVLNCKKSFLERAYCESARSHHGGESIGGSVAPPASEGPVPANQVAERHPKSTSAAVWVVLAVAIALVGLVLGFVWRRMRAHRKAARRDDSEYALQHTPGIPSAQAKPV